MPYNGRQYVLFVLGELAEPWRGFCKSRRN